MLAWGGEPVDRGTPEMLHEAPGGIRMGWASMETRLRVARLPRAGDRIQSFSAVIGLRDKTSHRILWAYDVDRGDLLITFEIVNLAFDIGARRSMSIPPHIRAFEQAATHEDLAPRAPSSPRRAIPVRPSQDATMPMATRVTEVGHIRVETPVTRN